MTATIPVYSLYGEQSGLGWENFFNVELLSYRSKALMFTIRLFRCFLFSMAMWMC